MTAQYFYAWVFLCWMYMSFVPFALGQSAASEEDVPLVERSVTLRDTIPPLLGEYLLREPWYYSLDEAMRNPESVYKLSLQDEKLSNFPGVIPSMKNLQILNLSENKIKSIPESISSLVRLEILILNDNQIRTLPESMRDMLYLRELYVSKNKLTQIPAWMGGLGKLRQLDISYNPITTYEIELLRELLPKCKVTN